MSTLKPGLYRVVVQKAATMEVREGEYTTENDLVAEVSRSGEVEYGFADSLNGDPSDDEVLSDATGVR